MRSQLCNYIFIGIEMIFAALLSMKEKDETALSQVRTVQCMKTNSTPQHLGH